MVLIIYSERNGVFMSVVSRLKQVIDTLFDGDADRFSRSVGLDKSMINQVLDGIIVFPLESDKLLMESNINPEFIRTGSGSMMINSTIKMERGSHYHNGNGTKENNASSIEILKDHVNTLKESNKLLIDQNDQLMKENKRLIGLLNSIIRNQKKK